MYKLHLTKRFVKDAKKLKPKDIEHTMEVLEKLCKNQTLEAKYKDHALKGNWIGYRECHIRPDWILVYRIVNEKLLLVLQRTGTHSELFKK